MNLGLVSAGLLSALVAPTLARPGVAHAQPSDEAPFAGSSPSGGSAAPMAATGGRFGVATQWVLTMQTAPGSGFAFFHRPSGGDWEISVHPALDYFLLGNVSVGGVAGIFHSPAATGTTNLDLGARAGFNLGIADGITFWPVAGINARVTSANHDTSGASSLSIFAPFLYHPAAHFFVGLGPSFQVGLSGGSYNVFGVDFMIGGWI
jgi:hypothetical protein